MTRQIFTNPTKTYKTYQNAVKAAEKIIEKNQDTLPGATQDRFAIGATEDGRFHPIINSRNSTFIYYAHDGFCVIGN